jgi:hypothetical protein
MPASWQGLTGTISRGPGGGHPDSGNRWHRPGGQFYRASTAGAGTGRFPHLAATPHLRPHPRCRGRLLEAGLLTGQPIRLPGATENEWSQYVDTWVDTRDLAWAAAECPARPLGEAYAVINGHFTWHDFYTELVRLTSSHSRIEHWRLDELPDNRFYAQTWDYSGQHIEQQLGFHPACRWQDTLAEIVPTAAQMRTRYQTNRGNTMTNETREPPTMYALLIRIDCYLPDRLPDGRYYPKLGGCERDIAHVEALLKRAFQMLQDNILKLTATDTGTQEQAEPRKQWLTYENVIPPFKQLKDMAQPGDQVTIHYSGHGGRAPTLLPELKGEGGLDKGLVPTDIGDSDARYVRDIELTELLNDMVTKGSTVAVVSNSCHSGGST